MILALAPLAALAADTWSAPAPGVSLLERTTADQRIFAAYVDICEPGMHARATKYEERRQSTSDWATDIGAVAAINGAFFSYDDYDAIGWSIGDGETWPTAVDYEHYTAIAFDDYGAVELFDADVPFPTTHAWREMVPGDPLLVDDGVLVEEDCYSHMCERHPRTAVGLSADERTVLLVAVDGRSDVADGMTRAELAQLLLDLGAHRAMNLDGGGSTTLWIDGLGVVNEPSDGAERVVASHLGFTLAGDTPCCIPTPTEGASGIFGDLPDGHWARGYAEALYTAGVTTGCEDDPLLFCPDCVPDRGQLAVLIARGLGLAPATPATFGDVEPDDWRAPYIEALYQAGITTGCGGGDFCPDRPATRWEAAAFVKRGMGLPDATPTGRFADLSESEAAVVEALADACVVSGCADGLFCPDEAVTRAEVAAMEAVGFSIGGYAPCLGGDTGAPDTGDTDDGDTGAPDTGDTDGGDTDGGDTDAPADTDVPAASRRPADDAACGCAAGGSALPALAPLLLALLLARRRARA